MAYVKIDNDNKVVQKQPNAEEGFIEAADSVVCGQIYQDGEFIDPPKTAEQLKKRLGKLRWKAETGGIDVGGMTIPTDDRAKLLINAAYNRAMQENDPEKQFRFKVGGSFFTITNAVITTIALDVAAHVQACFDAEAVVSDLIDSGDITDIEEVTAAFEAAL